MWCAPRGILFSVETCCHGPRRRVQKLFPKAQTSTTHSCQRPLGGSSAHVASGWGMRWVKEHTCVSLTYSQPGCSPPIYSKCSYFHKPMVRLQNNHHILITFLTTTPIECVRHTSPVNQSAEPSKLVKQQLTNVPREQHRFLCSSHIYIFCCSTQNK